MKEKLEKILDYLTENPWWFYFILVVPLIIWGLCWFIKNIK